MDTNSLLTLGSLRDTLKAYVGKGLTLFASLGHDHTVFLSGAECEASDTNFLFRAVTAKNCRAAVDTFVKGFDQILGENPGLSGLHVWVEVDGVGYPVAARHVGAEVKDGLVVMLLDPACGVRP